MLLGIASHTDAVRVCQVFDEPQEHLRRNDVIYTGRVEFVEKELCSPRNRGTEWPCNRDCTFKCWLLLLSLCCHEPTVLWVGRLSKGRWLFSRRRDYRGYWFARSGTNSQALCSSPAGPQFFQKGESHWWRDIKVIY